MKWQDVRRDLPLASDRGSDPTLLDRLSSHPDWEVRGAVAKNPTTRPQTLHKLALKYNTDNLIGISVAENPSTEPRTLKVLGLRHPWPWVRIRAAEHPNSPANLLEQLAKDPREDIRAAVARNPSVSIELLYTLSRDRHIDVRESVLTDHKTPIEILLNLRKDDSKYIRDLALEIIKYRIEEADPQERERIERASSMSDIGINYFSNEIDLDDLDSIDLGESRRAVERFKIWESLLRHRS